MPGIDETNTKRDQAVLQHLIDTHGADLGLRGLSRAAQAEVLHGLSQRAGLNVAKGTFVAILNGNHQKRPRHIDTYEGITRIFAALDRRLIREEAGRPNCFLIPLPELLELAATYRRPPPGGAALQEGLARMQGLGSGRLQNSGAVLRLQGHQSEPPQAAAGNYASIIFENWKSSAPDHLVPVPGVYQIVRRHKPPRGHASSRREEEPTRAASREYDWSDPANHAVVFELVYIDSSALECILITAEGNKYIGTLNINYDQVLFALLQRVTSDSPPSLNHRFIAVTLPKDKLPFYSGVTIKVGDTTWRPLASECLFVRIPQVGHMELYECFDRLRADIGNTYPVEEGSVLSEYISANPPNSAYDRDHPSPEWSRVKFLREFPSLVELTRERPNGKSKFVYFREPSRTMDRLTIAVELVRDLGISLPIFRWTNPEDAQAKSKKEGSGERE
jgi:hypothetical protein